MMLRMAVIALWAIGISGCVSPIGFASKRHVPLSYVGAFTFGKPESIGRSSVVPLVVDWHTGEWLKNSALAAFGTVARVKENKITFFVLVSLANDRDPLVLRLPKLAAGDYSMIYADPDGTKHPVGSLRIN